MHIDIDIYMYTCTRIHACIPATPVRARALDDDEHALHLRRVRLRVERHLRPGRAGARVCAHARAHAHAEKR
jgi:hypothetical protein